MTATVQEAWPFVEPADDVWVSAHCRLRDRDGYRVVTVRGVVVAHHSLGTDLARR